MVSVPFNSNDCAMAPHEKNNKKIKMLKNFIDFNSSP
jgi:hypothetical protein